MHTVLVDCDDVLLQWKNGFRQFLASKHNIATPPEGPTGWCMASWVGRTPDETVALIEEFNASKYFGELTPHPFAVAALTDLYARGYNIEVITSCGCDPASVVRRTRNLTLIFKHLISDIHCVPLGTSKIATLSKFDQAHWIEDNYENALAGHMVGHKSFVIRQRHNAALEHTSHAGITWVDNLMQIAKKIPNAQ